jgi:Tol biopolymer transport system component
MAGRPFPPVQAQTLAENHSVNTFYVRLKTNRKSVFVLNEYFRNEWQVTLNSHRPVCSPDGRELSYRSRPLGHFTLWHIPADRSRAAQKVPPTGIQQNAESWSPDGRWLAYCSNESESHTSTCRPSRDRAPKSRSRAMAARIPYGSDTDANFTTVMATA